MAVDNAELLLAAYDYLGDRNRSIFSVTAEMAITEKEESPVSYVEPWGGLRLISITNNSLRFGRG